MNYENELNAAAEWWADQLRQSMPGRNNGARPEDDPSGYMVSLGIMDGLRAPSADEEQIGKFKSSLVEILRRRVEPFDKNPLYYVPIGTDYGPDGDLAEAADAAGISHRRFPWKTVMWIRPAHVSVRAGYGQDQVTIFPRA